MKVRLLRDTKPYGRTGEIVEVSPSARDWLLSLGMAVPVEIGERIETSEKRPEAEITVRIPAKAAAKKPAAKKEKGK